MRISDWSSDVCSSDLPLPARGRPTGFFVLLPPLRRQGRAGEGLRQRRRLPEGSVRAVTTPSQPPPAFAGGGAKARNNAMDFSRFFIDRDRKSTRLNSSH